MKTFFLCCALGATSLSASAASNQMDVSFSNDTGKVGYSTSLSREAYQKTQLRGSVLFNTNSDYLLQLGARVIGDAGSDVPGLLAGVGVDILAGSVDKSDVYALPLSVMFEYRPATVQRLIIGGSFTFAPDVLAFKEASRIQETHLRVGYELFPETSVYLGYRRFTAHVNNNTQTTFDNGMHIGINFSF